MEREVCAVVHARAPDLGRNTVSLTVLCASSLSLSLAGWLINEASLTVVRARPDAFV